MLAFKCIKEVVYKYSSAHCPCSENKLRGFCCLGSVLLPGNLKDTRQSKQHQPVSGLSWLHSSAERDTNTHEQTWVAINKNISTLAKEREC